jgi:DnaJ-class molecular chaperone
LAFDPEFPLKENLYNVLGVAPNASDEEIKKVYRSLAMRFHPDRNDAPGAEVRFKSITKAYEILSDPHKRAEYDQSVNHRIIIDAEAEAYQLWRSVFQLHGTTLPPN